MKAKLIKTGNNYLLKEYGYGETLAITSGTMEGRKLSLKNCEAIANGYDLDELAIESSREYFIKPIESPIFTFGYEEGFQKALEIIGDKKFNEKDMIMFGLFCRNNHISECLSVTDELFPKYQSLQQTEWDVEIVCLHTGDPEHTTNTGLPKLDADGCLILKQI